MGYDRESPAYLVYHDDIRRGVRSRRVKFTDSFVVPSSNIVVSDDDFPAATDTDDVDVEIPVIAPVTVPDVPNEPVNDPVVYEDVPIVVVPVDDSVVYEDDISLIEPSTSPSSTSEKRKRRLPKHLDDYVCSNLDFCFTLSNYSIPATYSEALTSPESKKWKEAMNDEMESLAENYTFDLVPLPQDKKVVGGRWVYTLKDSPDDTK